MINPILLFYWRKNVILVLLLIVERKKLQVSISGLILMRGSAWNLVVNAKIIPCSSMWNSVYNNRSRPCLQYQIGRCSTCVPGYVTDEEYNQQVELARLFCKERSASIRLSHW